MDAIIDWLSFTVKQFEGKNAAPKAVIQEILNLDFDMFQPSHGGYGYKKQFIYNSIKIYYDGQEDMGVHVQISGEGIRYLETTQKNFNWSEFLYMLVNWYNVKLTRLDIAVDEMEGIIDLEYLEQKMKNGEVVSRWKQGEPRQKHKLINGEGMGKTLYFGNRPSDILCRFYDKRKQMQDKYEAQGLELPTHWIRCELEMRGERAANFPVEYYNTVKEKGFGTLFFEVLNNYMRVTDKGNDTNRSRWKNCEMWDRFIEAVSKLKLTLRKAMTKIEDSYIWVKKSVAPTLHMLFKASGGDLDTILELIKDGGKRLSKKHIMMLQEYENRPKGEIYTLEMHRHDIKEKMYNAEWELAERHNEGKRLLNALINIYNKKSYKPPKQISMQSIFGRRYSELRVEY
jgi:phage replication initiation protein